MTQPTAGQQLAVIEYLDKCEPEQWTAFTRWMRDELLDGDDQKMISIILFREAERRNERANKFKTDSNQVSLQESYQSVLTDLGLKLTA